MSTIQSNIRAIMGKKLWRNEVDEILQQILGYLQRIEDVTNICQEPNKSEMFKIFRDAFLSGYCGTRYKESKSGLIVRKAPKKSQIYDETIENYAREHEWINATSSTDSKRYRDLECVKVWWNEWTYAWDKNPPKRKYVRRNQS